MPQETTSSPTPDVAAEVFVLLGHDPRSAPRPGAVTLAALLTQTRVQLLDYARRLGLTGVAKLTKDELAARVQLALDRVVSAPAPQAPCPESQRETQRESPPRAEKKKPAPENARDPENAKDAADQATFPPKFDLGPDFQQKPAPQHIPWSYGQNRVTGMVVDPDRMFVYWECTDAAIENARRALGAGGREAWLALRIYDVTGRLFDGTNAHSYFDHNVARSDRQWFFEIGRPTSVACVELGLKSTEGYFAKISRSGRVEFPRREPIGPNHVEWLTVSTDRGDAGAPVAGAAAQTGAGAGAGAGGGGGVGPAGGGGMGAARELHGVPEWNIGGGGPGPGGVLVGTRAFERRWEWRDDGGVTEPWQSERRAVEWVGPMVRSAWEAGPFTYPVQSPAYIEEWNDGAMSVSTENGQVHVVYGPWQVVIRGIGAKAERRILSTWEIRRTWWTTAGFERSGATDQRLGPGGSEWLAGGASERAWLGGSEIRFGGASELFALGASELRFRGASETLFSGASEWRARGASEFMYGGASELLYGGASELRFEGDSEHRLSYPETVGGSEHRLFPTGVANVSSVVNLANVKVKG
jgi:hypothetical protein